MSINLFGGQYSQPTYLSYTFYRLTADNSPLQLNWSNTYSASLNPTANVIDVLQDINDGVIIMPDATQTSVGASIQFNNKGDFGYVIKAFGGVEIIVSPIVEACWTLILTDSSTAAGAWDTIQAGAYPAGTNASALAGLGLVALPSTLAPMSDRLNTNTPVLSEAANFTVDLTYRASLVVVSGETETCTLPAVLPPNGFFFEISNQNESTPLNIAGNGFLINGQPHLTLAAGTSVSLVTDGTTWYAPDSEANTSGGGVKFFTAAGGTFVLDSSDLQASTLIFTGVLTSDLLVTVFPVDGQWNVQNSTTGSFTFSIGLSNEAGGIAGNTFTLQQGESWAFYNVVEVNLAAGSPSIFKIPTPRLIDGAFPTGSAAEPSITFLSDSTTGLYLADPLTNKLGFASAGIAQGTVNNPDGWVFITNVKAAEDLTVEADFFGTTGVFSRTLQCEGLTATTGNFTGTITGINETLTGTLTVPTINLTNPLPIASGGTAAGNKTDAFNNLSPMTTTGDMIYASAANTASPLAIAAELGSALISGTVPSWGGYGILQIESSKSTTVLSGTTPTNWTNSTPIQIKNNNSKVLIIVSCACGVKDGNGGVALARTQPSISILYTGALLSADTEAIANVSFSYMDGPFAAGTVVAWCAVISPSPGATVYTNTNPAGTFTGESTITVIEIGGF